MFYDQFILQHYVEIFIIKSVLLQNETGSVLLVETARGTENDDVASP